MTVKRLVHSRGSNKGGEGTWALLKDCVHGHLGFMVLRCLALLHCGLLAPAALRRNARNFLVILRVDLHSTGHALLARSLDGVLDRRILVVCSLLRLLLCRSQSRLYALGIALLRGLGVFSILERLFRLGIEIRGLCLVGASGHVQHDDDGDEEEYAVEPHAALWRHSEGFGARVQCACGAFWGM
jgi:hypothetical protein